MVAQREEDLHGEIRTFTMGYSILELFIVLTIFALGQPLTQRA
jgi:hypothetical protein